MNQSLLSTAPAGPALSLLTRNQDDRDVLDDVVFPDSENPQAASQPFLQSFAVDSLAKATWVARRIAQAQRRIEERFALADAYNQKISDWLAKSNSSDESSISYFEMILRPWLESELSTMGKRRTVDLFEVSVSLRKRPAHLTITDEQTALAFCNESHPDAVVTTQTLSKSTVKSLIQSGHAIPGAVLEEGRDDMVVKAKHR